MISYQYETISFEMLWLEVSFSSGSCFHLLLFWILPSCMLRRGTIVALISSLKYLHYLQHILCFLLASNMCFAAASRPNIRKNGEIPEDSVGKKLYADAAFHTKSSQPSRRKPFCICLPTVALRNLWNPSILPLH